MSKATPLFFLAALFALTPLALANGLPTVKLTASRTAVLNDGRDATELMAEVRDTSGRPVPDGTPVTFYTNLGTFAENNTVQTRAGTARQRPRGASRGNNSDHPARAFPASSAARRPAFRDIGRRHEPVARALSPDHAGGANRRCSPARR